ncbi:alpha/beta fold hydrolase [Parafrankia sp. BMG5.11]|uniref:alpha/beta fold hydrolase n=1 Tax=Parafrankia sp. BMG5.11 TaxID=222540 RepID=UPI0027D2C775|nr:alpha/beta fold hydrolase [Parafrankia sp. BMG5.11]
MGVVLDRVREESGASIPNLLGTSFGGDLAAYYAAKRPDELSRPVLPNPRLD